MKKWTVAPLDKAQASEIQQKYNLPSIIAMLLQIRGIHTKEQIEDFLFNESSIASPFEIKDMDKAAARVRRAVDSGELICVYGDYDADGVTSTALVFSYLEAIGANAMYYIPSRENEGYGMNKAAVQKLSEHGVKLILTVDNGIAANEEIDYASSLGIDTVVTDHHMPLSQLPNAVAVVDLHRGDCQSRFKHLSGVGVAFKLIMALEGEYCDVDSLLDNYSDLLCIGTIGDIVQLTNENRVFVKRGLTSISNTDRPGLMALIEESGLGDKELSSGTVSFSIVPRINAAGRLGGSGKSVELLLSEDYERAGQIARAMCEDNSERRQIESKILESIDAVVRENPSLVMSRIIVLDGEGWHQGVIGIVASRIREVYGKPVIVISREGENARASGRSVDGFALCDAVAACSDLLTHYGGHPMAVGLSLKSDNIKLFRKRINEFAMAQQMPFDELRIECKLNPAFVSVDMIEDLNYMRPYGAGNPTPVFGFFNMKINNIIPLSNNKHIKLQLSKNGADLTALKFSTTVQDFPFSRGDFVDIAATLDVNEYNGVKSAAVYINDIKPAGEETQSLLESLRIFEDFCLGARLSRAQLESIFPSRDDFALLYRFLRSGKGYFQRIDALPGKLNYALSLGKIRVILEAMSDLGLIRISEGLYRSRITLNNVNSKVSLEQARIIEGLRRYMA